MVEEGYTHYDLGSCLCFSEEHAQHTFSPPPLHKPGLRIPPKFSVTSHEVDP